MIKIGLGQTVFWVITFISLTYVSLKHGEPQEKYNFWTFLAAKIIDILLMYLLIVPNW